MWFWVVALVLVVGAIAVVVAGRDHAMAETYDDRPDRTIPTGRPLTAEDLEDVRFSSALRGYRMDEVDALIDRIAADLQAREQHARPEPTATRRSSDATVDEEAGHPGRHRDTREPVATERQEVGRRELGGHGGGSWGDAGRGDAGQEGVSGETGRRETDVRE